MPATSSSAAEMATTHFSRSRSPVLSIRTQPEEEDSLRAQIEAASRTQYEILPRYSWQSNLVKRNNNALSKCNARPSLLRDVPPSQLARSVTVDRNTVNEDLISHRHAISSRSDVPEDMFETPTKPWRKLTKRMNPLRGSSKEGSKSQSNSHCYDGRARTKISRLSKRVGEVVADVDREAQQAQFNAWLAEKMEEQNSVPEPPQSMLPKPKSTIRKSVYGSLSGKKSFFRGATKSPLEKLCNINIHAQPDAPHVYSFETKDQLRDYFHNAGALSPLPSVYRSPGVVLDSASEEPAELSAGPIPAELECNHAIPTAENNSGLSRMSSPSIVDLPPYIDEKKFGADIAKDRVQQSGSALEELPEGVRDAAQLTYTCSSCHSAVASHDVYDFCAICDNKDRVLCVRCAKRGPCCQHELEELLRACSLDQSPSHSCSALNESVSSGEAVESIRAESNASSRRCRDNPVNFEGQFPSSHVARQDTSHSTDLNAANSRPQSPDALLEIQAQAIKEVAYLRREQDLVYRERELGLRAREIEIRDQQTTLRERETVLQQKNDILIGGLETLLSHKGPVENCAISVSREETFLDQSIKDKLAEDFRPVPGQYRHAENLYLLHCANGKADLSRSIRELGQSRPSYRDHGVSKRKKESSVESSNSLPAATSSPGQSYKNVQRGNSDRSNGRDDDGDEEGRRFPKKYKQATSSPSGPLSLFACPFSKHDPLRYSSRNLIERSYRGCEMHFLTDVSRLKQHLKRVHWQPETYCPRCYEEFEDSTQLAVHARAPIACPARDCPFPEKMDKSKQEKIHVKRPRVAPEIVWYDIYKALFPGSPLPESPYIEKDKRVATPLSPVPLGSTSVEAMEQLTESFTKKLNEHPELKNSHLRPLINQALAESFIELLSTFSVSSATTPGPGPSILVSPVSGPIEKAECANASPSGTQSSSANLNQDHIVSDDASCHSAVPSAQQTRPPKLQLNTKLHVSPDHPRSLAQDEVLTSDDSADVIFEINLPAHVREDTGYDDSDECRSYEQGDDLQAMKFFSEPPQPLRNKSVISIDSGYGSGRSQQPRIPYLSGLMPVNSIYPTGVDQYQVAFQENDNSCSQQPQTVIQNLDHYSSIKDIFSHFAQPEYGGPSNKPFESYSNFLDVPSQEEIWSGIDVPFDPWRQP